MALTTEGPPGDSLGGITNLLSCLPFFGVNLLEAYLIKTRVNVNNLQDEYNRFQLPSYLYDTSLRVVNILLVLAYNTRRILL